MKRLFYILLATASIVSATPFTYQFSDIYGGQNPGAAANNGDVVGALRRFDIDRIRLSGNGGLINVSIFMNYGQEGGDTELDPINLGSLPSLNPGDIMFRSGSYLWAVPLVSHNDSAAATGSMIAGNLYRVNSFLTAQQVLNNAIGSYRPTAPVWGQATGATKTGNGEVTTDGIGGAEIRVDVELFTEDNSMIQALSSGNFELLFASATCSNDVLTGTGTPEPFTMALIGSGLVGLGAMRLRKS